MICISDIFSIIKRRYMIFLGTIFLLVRLIWLHSLPIFNDEAIYLHWGIKFFRNLEIGFPLLVTLDGKQAGIPIVYGLLQFLPTDPLITARLFGVLFSLFTYYYSLKIFNYFYPHDNPLLYILLLTFCPYLLFFDRMALPENVIIACYTAAFYFIIKISEKPTLKLSILLGLFLAFGWWFKSTILLFFPPLFLFIFLLVFKNRKKCFMKLGYIIISGLVFLLFISPLLLSSDYQRVSFNEMSRVLSLSEILNTPIQNVLIKINNIFFWFFNLTSPLAIVGFIFSFCSKKSMQKKYLLMLFVILPILLEAIFLKIFTSRYIVFVVQLFLILVYEGIKNAAKIGRYLGLLITGNLIIISTVLIFFPAQYYQLMKRLPVFEEDQNQYFIGWTSGWGIKEAVDYIYEDARNKNVIVFVRRDSGNPEDAVYVYLNKNITSVSLIDFLPRYKKQKDVEMYYLSRGTQMAGLTREVQELKVFPKPYDNEYIGVYKIIN